MKSLIFTLFCVLATPVYACVWEIVQLSQSVTPKNEFEKIVKRIARGVNNELRNIKCAQDSQCYQIDFQEGQKTFFIMPSEGAAKITVYGGSKHGLLVIPKTTTERQLNKEVESLIKEIGTYVYGMGKNNEVVISKNHLWSGDDAILEAIETGQVDELLQVATKFSADLNEAIRISREKNLPFNIEEFLIDSQYSGFPTDKLPVYLSRVFAKNLEHVAIDWFNRFKPGTIQASLYEYIFINLLTANFFNKPGLEYLKAFQQIGDIDFFRDSEIREGLKSLVNETSMHNILSDGLDFLTYNELIKLLNSGYFYKLKVSKPIIDNLTLGKVGEAYKEMVATGHAAGLNLKNVLNEIKDKISRSGLKRQTRKGVNHLEDAVEQNSKTFSQFVFESQREKFERVLGQLHSHTALRIDNLISQAIRINEISKRTELLSKYYRELVNDPGQLKLEVPRNHIDLLNLLVELKLENGRPLFKIGPKVFYPEIALFTLLNHFNKPEDPKIFEATQMRKIVVGRFFRLYSYSDDRHRAILKYAEHSELIFRLNARLDLMIKKNQTTVAQIDELVKELHEEYSLMEEFEPLDTRHADFLYNKFILMKEYSYRQRKQEKIINQPNTNELEFVIDFFEGNVPANWKQLKKLFHQAGDRKDRSEAIISFLEALQLFGRGSYERFFDLINEHPEIIKNSIQFKEFIGEFFLEISRLGAIEDIDVFMDTYKVLKSSKLNFTRPINIPIVLESIIEFGIIYKHPLFLQFAESFADRPSQIRQLKRIIISELTRRHKDTDVTKLIKNFMRKHKFDDLPMNSKAQKRTEYEEIHEVAGVKKKATKVNSFHQDVEQLSSDKLYYAVHPFKGGDVRKFHFHIEKSVLDDLNDHTKVSEYERKAFLHHLKHGFMKSARVLWARDAHIYEFQYLLKTDYRIFAHFEDGIYHIFTREKAHGKNNSKHILENKISRFFGH